VARELTVMLVRGSGRSPITLRLSAGTVFAVGLLASTAVGACLWVGFRLGELTFLR